jgi:hypothetical protein
MKGHKRPGGVLVCPIPENDSITKDTTIPPLSASPPVTPPRRSQTPVEKASQSPIPALGTSRSPPLLPTPPPTLPRSRIDPSFVIPERGPWHRRNPNWEESTPPPERPVLRAASLVPTVLVDDDGKTVQGSDDGNNRGDVEMDDDDNDGRDIDPFYTSVRRPKEPVVSIWSTKREDIQGLRDEAASVAVYTGVMRSPVKFKIEGESAGAYAPSAEGSWLVVASRNPELVKLVLQADSGRHQAASQVHRTLPGGMKQQSMNDAQVKLVANLQLMFTGFWEGLGFAAACVIVLSFFW